MVDSPITKTVISEEIYRSSQPWLELDAKRDKTGLTEGDDTLFGSLAEKAEYYRQPLFGKRFSTAAFLKSGPAALKMRRHYRTCPAARRARSARPSGGGARR